MDSTADQLAALADADRWRIVGLLAERPRSVGVVAQLTGLRQPQTSKHLSRLERAGLVVSQRSGQRRIYALEPAPLRAIAARLGDLAGLADSVDRASFDAYGKAMAVASASADAERWADDRVYAFHRTLPARRATVWRHLTDAATAAAWWAPDGLAVSDLVIDARPGGRFALEYCDADADSDAGTDVVGRAEGVVDAVAEPERFAFRLSPLLPDGGLAFTGHYEFALSDTGTDRTAVDIRLRITDSAVAAADLVAGIELGWNQSLDKLADAIASEKE